MPAEPLIVIVAAVAILNAGLTVWLLVLLRAQGGSASGLALSSGGRFDAIERNHEALRQALTEMDQALRREIASGTRDGLAVAFDKVQDGTRAQSEQLGAFGRQLADGLGNLQLGVNQFGHAVTTELGRVRQAVTEKLAESETRNADGRTALVRDVRGGFDGFAEQLRLTQEQLRDKVESSLEKIRTGNEAKLEQMRRAVDEQLQSALEQRLNESFQRVAQQFAEVQQAIGQVQSVTGQIGDLKRLFSNVKSRGGWGEAHIQALLDDVLPPGAYETNLRLGSDGGEVVEFALRMPLSGSADEVWLAIDAKFPTEDYDRLVLASETGDRDQETAARKALERRIREEGKRISSKYISPPRTVEFAVMYLPSEGLFGEVCRIPGLIETLRRQFGIMVMGPGLLPGLLHCIRVGHLTLTLEQKAGIIGEILSAVKAEWGNLAKSIDTLAKRAETLSNGIRETQKRTRVVGRTLRTVGALDFDRAQQVLGLSDEATSLIDAEPADEGGPITSGVEAVRASSERREAAE